LARLKRVTADVRTEREGFVTDDAFDIWLHYRERDGGAGESMLSTGLRPRLW